MCLKPRPRLSGRLARAVLAVGLLLTISTIAIASDGPCAPIKALTHRIQNVENFRTVVEYTYPDGDTRIEEHVMIGTKHYYHWQGLPWRVNQRQMTLPAKPFSNCKYVGRERVNGVEAKLYTYDRQDWQAAYTVRMWISEESRLPVKSHWKETKPAVTHNELIVTYFFEPDLKEPI